jgi:hypothetical protein
MFFFPSVRRGKDSELFLLKKGQKVGYLESIVKGSMDNPLNSKGFLR